MRRIRTFLVCALWLIGATAQAQWQWLDKSGRKVFSDQPPPADIPARNILKQPGKTAMSAPVAAAAAPPAATASVPAPAVAAPQLSAYDKDLQAKKNQAEAETQAKIKAEADRLARAKATNCEKARANQAVLDSGVRVAVKNDKGEREFLDDAGRAQEQRKIRLAIESNCK